MTKPGRYRRPVKRHIKGDQFTIGEEHMCWCLPKKKHDQHGNELHNERPIHRSHPDA